MRRLNEREKMILSMRFFEGKTQMEVADEIGISQAQVSRLEKSAISQMQKIREKLTPKTCRAAEQVFFMLKKDSIRGQRTPCLGRTIVNGAFTAVTDSYSVIPGFPAPRPA